MKTLATILIAFFTSISFAQSNYEQGMQKAFDLWKADNLDEAANLFERIATAESENWLPAYYVAQIYILKNWDDFANRKESTIKANLDKAQEYINELETRSPGNNYGKYLKAQLYTVWVAHDGRKYGIRYAGTIEDMYREISKAEPKNPIFLASKAEWGMGSARYFGTSLEPSCEDLQKAIDLFATFKPESEFHPTGSVAQARKLAESCNK